MSSFIRSMPSAGLIEMPPVSNVMPLPTRPSTGAVGRARRIVRAARCTRGGSALPRATPSSSPMPERCDLAPRRAPRPTARVPSRRRLRALGEHARRQHVRRLVGELPREVRALREDAPALHGAGGGALSEHDRSSRGARRRARRNSGTPFLCRPVSTLPEDDALGGPCARRSGDAAGRGSPDRGAATATWSDPALPSRQHPGRRDAAREVGAETGPGTRADERHAARLPARRHWREEELERLSRDLAPAGGAQDLAAGCGVQPRQSAKSSPSKTGTTSHSASTRSSGKASRNGGRSAAMGHPAIIAHPGRPFHGRGLRYACTIAAEVPSPEGRSG